MPNQNLQGKAARQGSAAQPGSSSSSNGSTSSRRSSQKSQRRRQLTPTTQQVPYDGSAAPLPASKLLEFERQGFLVTKQLLQVPDVRAVKQCAEQVIAQDMLSALRHRVRVLCPNVTDLEAIKTEQQALQLIQRSGSSQLGFLQFVNLHRQQPLIQNLARDLRLAGTAAQLLGVKRLRLYQDCVFLKQSGWSETNWHSDLRMAPLDTNAFLTAWIPLRAIRGCEADSGLLFAAGSHRDFALPFWHDLQGRDLSDRQYKLTGTGPMALGDVSWHHGWLLHAAGAQPAGSAPRLALTLSFFADGARLLARKSDSSVLAHMQHDEDAESYSGWLSELKDGAVARHALLPLVW